jgi:8-oxo-dGTP pyrophosphatase MutT (NUDIX family)
VTAAGGDGRDGGSVAGGHVYEVLDSRQTFAGRVIAIRSDDVAMPDGEVSTRDVVVHPGAVAVVALDDADRVVMVRQYRHPVTERLWELPAGLLDVEGEPAVRAAARELEEEAGLRATRWDVLVDALTSPGMTDEAIRVFLARDLVEVGRPAGEHEEAEMDVAWVGLAEAVEQVLGGVIRNGVACIGILAAATAARNAFAGLRSADSDWPDRPGH